MLVGFHFLFGVGQPQMLSLLEVKINGNKCVDKTHFQYIINLRSNFRWGGGGEFQGRNRILNRKD